jgi:hypothetical protein
VITFIVGQDRVVYLKALGRKTAILAKAMREYDPNSTWKRDEDQ